MAGIVLAGGRSTRMGADKALLPWDGRTVIEVVIERVAEAAGEVLVVADVQDRYALANGIRVVADHYPGTGPLGGIVTGLAAAGEGVHVVVGCDMPDLRAALLRLLLGEADAFDAAVPEVAGRLEPLCAAYAISSLVPLRASLEAGDRAVQRALGELRLRRVPEWILRTADPGLESFRNINTPEDYATFARLRTCGGRADQTNG